MISSLLSLLSSLFPLPSALVLRPSDLDRACLSLLAQGLSQTLLQFSCSSVVHYLIASRLISSLSSLLSSLFPLPSAIVLRLSDLDRACHSLLVQGLSQTLSVSQVLLFNTGTFYLLSSLFNFLQKAV